MQKINSLFYNSGCLLISFWEVFINDQKFEWLIPIKSICYNFNVKPMFEDLHKIITPNSSLSRETLKETELNIMNANDKFWFSTRYVPFVCSFKFLTIFHIWRQNLNCPEMVFLSVDVTRKNKHRNYLICGTVWIFKTKSIRKRRHVAGDKVFEFANHFMKNAMNLN